MKVEEHAYFQKLYVSSISQIDLLILTFFSAKNGSKLCQTPFSFGFLPSGRVPQICVCLSITHFFQDSLINCS